MINLSSLDYSEFEILIGILLKLEGHRILRGPGRPGTSGPEYETISSEGLPYLVEVRHYIDQKNAGLTLRSPLQKLVAELARFRQQKPSARGLLVTNVTPIASSVMAAATAEDFDIWDGKIVASFLARHREVNSIFRDLIEAKDSFRLKVQALLGEPNSRSEELSLALRSLPCGRAHWKDYEVLCTELLSYLFVPDLGIPELQSRSDDGLDIIDAIFPIRSHSPPWSVVRSEYRTRFVVAEFKNYCDPIGQTAVESLAEYLYHPAQRQFGLLVSRRPASVNATAQRRRKWIDGGKYIVLLSDDDLLEMLSLRDTDSHPYDVIDMKLEEFLRTLAP